jgi:hypothetical protein
LGREGIEVRPYLAESKDIFEKPDKVTLKLDPPNVWLLVDVLGRKFNASLMKGLEAELEQAPIRVFERAAIVPAAISIPQACNR